MSAIGSYVRMLFGGHATDDPRARASGGKNHQDIFENLTTTTSRVTAGPQRNGHMSFHIRVAAGTAPAGNLTVWYSNLVDPDPANDAHWVIDPLIAAIDLSVVANTFLNIGNVNAQHVRLKAVRSAGTIALNVFSRVEGVDA